jgi:hypothetical protein
MVWFARMSMPLALGLVTMPALAQEPLVITPVPLPEPTLSRPAKRAPVRSSGVAKPVRTAPDPSATAHATPPLKQAEPARGEEPMAPSKPYPGLFSWDERR